MGRHVKLKRYVNPDAPVRRYVVLGCLVVCKWDTFWWTTGIVVVTSIIMKINWYDRLDAVDDGSADAKIPAVEA